MEPLPQLSGMKPSLGRWWLAAGFAAAIAGYVVAINSGVLSSYCITVLNDVAWTAASLSTALAALFAARTVTGRERLAWRLIMVGAFLWFAGQCVWNYYELVMGQILTYPHWVQLMFAQYPLLVTCGLLVLPKPPGARGMTVRRAGNLGLAICTLAAILAITVTEPAAQSMRTPLIIAATILHGVLYAAACLVALYLLWGYRWQNAYWPLVLIAIGTGIHAAGFISDVHRRLLGTYHGSDLHNLVWLVSLGFVACAAYEYAWSHRHRPPNPPSALLARERWLEATMPAILVVAMVAIAIFNIEWISARVIYLVCGAGLLFSITLGIREAWVQHEEHRLLAALNESRDRLLATNEELSKSEQRFRSLNMQLEQHVAARTAELQAAYRELESFSYAVAHDIKAPLRAVNAFGALLAEEYGVGLDAKAHGYIDRMRRGSLHMAQLVDDLLAYARIERLALQSQATDIGVLILNCIAEQRDEIAKLDAQVLTDVAPFTLHVDNAALAQAIRNLLQNALKFSRSATPPRVAISAQRVADRLQISVADNGIGFDMQYHDKLFALFQRLHRPDEYAGTGIGLAIARKAIERLGGRLWAHSSINEGATFYIDLPIDTE
jgi:signal transduction histidine kinase